MSKTLTEINSLIPIHSLWDGFWVHDFDNGVLTLSCSFNRIYYRDFDIIFKGVTFFNLPDEWRDTDVPGDELLREADKRAFLQEYPNFDPGNNKILSIFLSFSASGNERNNYTFYIVCDSVAAHRCVPEDNKPYKSYDDPLENEPWPCRKNRVPYL